MSSDWPLVGRAGELARLHDVIGSGGHVVLAGPAGVGKTRLARETTDAFRCAGFATEWVIGTRAAATIPFGAVASLLPEPMTRATRSDPSVDTMAAIREAVLARAGGRGLVLAIDDAHCLDDATATLVQQLATTTDARLLVVLRSGDPAPEAVTALWKDGIAERLDLRPLADADTWDLLARALGGPVEERTAWELTHRCAGNCMFLSELVRAAQAAEAFRFEQGRWRLQAELPTSARLVELVEARTGGLPVASRALLEYLALGEPLPLTVLVSLMGHEVLDDASRLGLVDVDQDRRRAMVRLSHPLYGEVLRSGLPTLRARTRSRALVEAFESTPLRRSDDIVRFASWSLDAGMPAEPDLLIRAAHRALEGADLRATERFAAAAVDQLTGREAPSGNADLIERQTRAILALADALVRQGRFDDASAVLDQAHPRAPSALAAEVVELQALGLFMGGDSADEPVSAPAARALALLEEAEGRFDDLPARLRLRIARASLLTLVGRPLDALQLLDRTATPTLELEHRWLAQRGPALAWMGRFEEAEQAIARGLALPGSDLVPPTISWIPRTTMLVALGRGEFVSFEAMMRGVLDHAKSLRHRPMQRAVATFLGCSILWQGRVTEAIELLIIGTDDTVCPDYQGELLLAFGALACAYAMAGDVESAQSTLDQAERDAHTPVRGSDYALAFGHAATARARGQQRESRDAIQAGLIQCHGSGSHLLEVLLALGACQIGEPELAAAFTAELITKVDSPLAVAAHDWATAAVARDAGRLETASRTLEGLSLPLEAAEAAATAADVHEDRGRPAEAVAGRARARRLLDRCPGADAPFLRRAGRPSALTARELEIARLAAAGLTSAEIAKGLYLSTRTVDTHLGRVYLKLDVRGRAELKDHPHLAQGRPRLRSTGPARRSAR